MLPEPFFAACACCLWRAGGLAAITSADLLVWSLLLVAIAALGGIILCFRRWLLEKEHKSEAGLSVEQLERLRMEGALTPEEYKRARLGLAGVSGKEPKAEKPRPGETDDRPQGTDSSGGGGGGAGAGGGPPA